MGLGGAGDVVKAVRDTEQERPNSAVQYKMNSADAKGIDARVVCTLPVRLICTSVCL